MIARRLPVALAALLVAVLAAVATARAGTAGDPGLFRHGMGVHNLLNWAALEPGDPSRYAWPPFPGPEHALDERLIGQVRAAGFDFVRLTVDPGPFMQMTGSRRAELDELVAAAVLRFRRHGLAVLLNLHSNSQVPAFRPEAVLVDPGSAAFASYLAVVGRTARLLAGLNDAGVAFEPVNEPPDGYDAVTTRRWQAMMEAIHAAVRAQAPDLLVVVTGAQGGNREALEALDPAPFPGALFSFHFYEPHILTHQGAEVSGPGVGFWRYMRGLPYPPRAEAAGQVLAEVERRIAADPAPAPADKARIAAEARQGIAAYRDGPWGRAAVSQAFDGVAAWARRHDVPGTRILLGEFGAARIDPATNRARAAWLRDVRCAAAAHGFAWSLWGLSGSSMGVAEPGVPGGLDPVTLGALGLAAGPPCASP